MLADQHPKRPTFFLAYSGGGQRGQRGLEEAKDAAWEMRRAGKLRPEAKRVQYAD